MRTPAKIKAILYLFVACILILSVLVLFIANKTLDACREIYFLGNTKIVNEEVNPGDRLKFEVEYCTNAQTNASISANIDGPNEFEYASIPIDLDSGCGYVFVDNYRLSHSLDEGEYVLKTYFSVDSKTYESDPGEFYLVKR